MTFRQIVMVCQHLSQRMVTKSKKNHRTKWSIKFTSGFVWRLIRFFLGRRGLRPFTSLGFVSDVFAPFFLLDTSSQIFNLFPGVLFLMTIFLKSFLKGQGKRLWWMTEFICIWFSEFFRMNVTYRELCTYFCEIHSTGHTPPRVKLWLFGTDRFLETLYFIASDEVRARVASVVHGHVKKFSSSVPLWICFHARILVRYLNFTTVFTV